MSSILEEFTSVSPYVLFLSFLLAEPSDYYPTFIPLLNRAIFLLFSPNGSIRINRSRGRPHRLHSCERQSSFAASQAFSIPFSSSCEGGCTGHQSYRIWSGTISSSCSGAISRLGH